MHIRTIALGLVETLVGSRLSGPTEGREVITAIRERLPSADVKGAITLVQDFDRAQTIEFFEMIESYTTGKTTPEEVSMITGSIIGTISVHGASPDDSYLTAMKDIVSGSPKSASVRLITAMVKDHAKRVRSPLSNYDALIVLVSDMVLKRLA